MEPASETSALVKPFCCACVKPAGTAAVAGIATATKPLVICVSTESAVEPVPVDVTERAGVEKNAGTRGVLVASATVVVLPTTAVGSVYASPGLLDAGTCVTTTIA